MFEMKGEIQVRTTKEGKDYDVLVLYMITKEGELLQVKEMLIRSHEKDIMQYIAKA